jgi:N utilization substance protein B
MLDQFGKELPEIEFAESLFDGVLKHSAEFDELIVKYAPEWPLDKIAKIDKCILEIGMYELLYTPDVPPLVAINESVELAKSFGDTNASKFINGVLSALAHDKIDPDKLKK